MKECSNCRILQPDDHFYQRSGRSGALHSWCIKCMKALRVKRNPEIAEYQKERRANFTEEEKQAGKDYQLKHKFGLALIGYESLLDEQGHVCAICGNIDPSRGLAVDHNHETKKVRGLLCGSCNNGLGRFKDSAELLDKAAAYLRLHEARKLKTLELAESILVDLMKI